MIAILTKESFYTIPMDSIEFMSLVMEKKINNTLIRAKSNTHCSKQDFEKFSKFFESRISEIDICFCEYGDNQYSMKSVKSIEDLKYFRGDDNELYTCKEEYDLLNVGEHHQTEEVAPTEELAPITSNSSIDTNPEFGLNLAYEDDIPDIPSYLSEDGLSTELEMINIDYKASALDHLLKNLPHLLKIVPQDLIGLVKKYIFKNKYALREDIVEPFLRKAEVDNIVTDGNTYGIKIKNSLEESEDLLDSLIGLPIMSRLVGYNDLEQKINRSSISAAKYLRICPIAEDSDGNIFGFVNKYDLTYEDGIRIEKQLKDRLKAENKSLRSLSPEERFYEWEKEVALFVETIKPLIKYGRVEFKNIGSFLTTYRDRGYIFPDVADHYGQPNWRTYEIAAIDNRAYENDNPISLTDQLANHEVYQASKDTPAPKNGVIYLSEKSNSTLENEAESQIVVQEFESTETASMTPGLQITDAGIAKLIDLFANKSVDTSHVRTNSDGEGEKIIIPPSEETEPKIVLENPFVIPNPFVGEVKMGGINPLNPYPENNLGTKKM